MLYLAGRICGDKWLRLRYIFCQMYMLSGSLFFYSPAISAGNNLSQIVKCRMFPHLRSMLCFDAIILTRKAYSMDYNGLKSFFYILSVISVWCICFKLILNYDSEYLILKNGLNNIQVASALFHYIKLCYS